MVSIIVAVDNRAGIGKDNDLLWHLPKDMQFFKETTNGHVVIMGRKNYESIPERFRPLPNRVNIVLTRNQEYDAKGAVVCSTMQRAMEEAKKYPDQKIFVIGGGEIYRLAFEAGLVDEMYITRVNANLEADVFFPEIQEDHWTVEQLQSFQKDEKHTYDFVIYRYIKK